MKTEQVNLATNDSTETVVLLSTEPHELTPAERVRALESAIWPIGEGWTVMTRADSPLAAVAPKGAEAIHGTYQPYESAAAGRIEKARIQILPQPNHHVGR